MRNRGSNETNIENQLQQVAIKRRLPYFGFCFTQTHVEELTQRVERMTFEAMKTEGDVLYEPGLCELLKGGGNKDEDEEGEEEEEEIDLAGPGNARGVSG
jgi:hypothetical protein